MSEVARHPIELAEVLFVRSSVISVPGHEPDAKNETLSPTNTINVVKNPDQPNSFQVQMRSVFNPEMNKAAPYFIDMECIANLTADDTLNEEEKLRGVTITGHSVLYGAIREAVAWLTGRQMYGSMMLGLSVLSPGPPPEKKT